MMDRRDFLYRSSLATAAVATSSLGAASSFGQTAKPKVRIGFAGLKHSHAMGKLAAILDSSDTFDLVGVTERDASIRKSLASHPMLLGVAWMAEDEMLERADIDAVIIETEVHELVPTAQRCIAAQKHIHLEKPGGESHEEFAKLFHAARANQRRIQLGYMLRYNPAFELCFQLVEEGVLGEVFEVTGSMSKLVDDEDRNEYASYKGGAMFELGCHLIDLLLTILGPPSKVSAFNRATRSDGVLDNQLAVFEYAKANATIRASIVEPHGSQRRHFEVSGANGTLVIRPLEPPQPTLTLQQAVKGYAAGRQEIALPKSPGRYHKQLRRFGEIVRGDRAADWSVDHDLAVHRAVLQASGIDVEGAAAQSATTTR